MIRIILPLALLAGCTATSQIADEGPDARISAAVEGKIAGQPQNCIRLDETRSSEVVRDAILYRASRTKTYLAHAPGCGTRGLNDVILIQNVFGAQVCRGDIVRLVQRSGGFEAGSCAIREITAYTTAKN